MMRWIRNFIWTGNCDQRKLVTVSWKNICLPKQNGGLGIRDLQQLNDTALLKSLWNILTKNSASSIFLKQRFKITPTSYSLHYAKSSIWPGLKKMHPLLAQGCRWLVGKGDKIHFWKDKWLSSPITQILNIQDKDLPLSTKVADLIHNNSWRLPPLFKHHFPHISAQIEAVTLPLNLAADRLIWENSSDGDLTFSASYDSVRGASPSLPWSKLIWAQFIPPKFSILAWKLIHKKLATDDVLKTKGCFMVSGCQMCDSMHCEESITHLFLHCSFARSLWNWMANLFDTSPPVANSLEDFWSNFFGKSFQSHTYHLWLVTGLVVIYHIWKAKLVASFDFEDVRFSISRTQSLCSSYISFLSSLCPGYVIGSQKPQIYDVLHLNNPLRRAPNIHTIFWLSPPIGWIKVNTDGLAKGNPGPSACGAVFRGGAFRGCFAVSLGHHSAFYAELYAIISAIEIAHSKGWHSLWIESDSLAAVLCLHSVKFQPPWDIRMKWLNCISILQGMQFRCSHIYSTGKVILLRIGWLILVLNVVLLLGGILLQQKFTRVEDAWGLPKYRFD